MAVVKGLKHGGIGKTRRPTNKTVSIYQKKKICVSNWHTTTIHSTVWLPIVIGNVQCGRSRRRLNINGLRILFRQENMRGQRGTLRALAVICHNH